MYNIDSKNDLFLTYKDFENNDHNIKFLRVQLEKEFNVVKETLERIGIGSKDKKTLTQSCHLFHKRGNYYITHFKEMFALDEKKVNLNEDDIYRRNYIAGLLHEWGMITILDSNESSYCSSIVENEISDLKIVSFKDKKDWSITSKYSMGK